MAKKRKTASSKIARLLKTIGDADGKSPYSNLGPEIDWDDPVVWSSEARKAFDPSNLDQSIRTAFDKFKLDPRNPHNWWMLLRFFADAHFGRSRGAPRKWSSSSLCELLRNISTTRKKRPNAKQGEVYRSLVKPGAPYEGKKPDSIKHAYSIALDPRHNDILFHLVDGLKDSYEKILALANEERGVAAPVAMPVAMKRKIENLALKQALEAIGAPDALWEKVTSIIFRENNSLTFYRRQ